MAMVIKYVPVWHVTYNGRTYSPAENGETPVTIEGLPKDEIKRLLEMKAIRKISFDEGTDVDTDEDNDDGDSKNERKPLEEMKFAELKELAKEYDISVAVGTSTEQLIEAIKAAEAEAQL